MGRFLKECPFCGSEDTLLNLRHGSVDYLIEPALFAHVSCDHYGARGSTCDGETQDEAMDHAIDSWNSVPRPGWLQAIKRRWNTIRRALQRELPKRTSKRKRKNRLCKRSLRR